MSTVVAIDGPSGSGKSSTSRGVAARLGLAYLDTGAMYRAITFALLRDGVDLTDADAVAAAAARVDLRSGTDPEHPTIHVGDEDVSAPIRGDDVTASVSPVAAVAAVRAQLVRLQRAVIDTATAGASAGIVVEGRDIGTVVAPDAHTKIYLVADRSARAARRAAEHGRADAEATGAALAERDRIDSTRTTSPLTQAPDAVVVDGTHLTLDQVVDEIVSIVESR